MILDITGIELVPGNFGLNCLGNGNHKDNDGNPIECCCDECDYLICCNSRYWYKKCTSCEDKYCPNKK